MEIIYSETLWISNKLSTKKGDIHIGFYIMYYTTLRYVSIFVFCFGYIIVSHLSTFCQVTLLHRAVIYTLGGNCQWPLGPHLLTWINFNTSMDDPDSKVHGANMGPIWGRQDPGGPHVGPMNFAIWRVITSTIKGGMTLLIHSQTSNFTPYYIRCVITYPCFN